MTPEEVFDWCGGKANEHRAAAPQGSQRFIRIPTTIFVVKLALYEGWSHFSRQGPVRPRRSGHIPTPASNLLHLSAKPPR